MAQRDEPQEDLDFQMKFFEKLVKGKADFLDALKPLAEIYTRKRLYDKGLEIDKKLADLCPNDPVVHYNLACSLALMHQKEAALNVLDQAVELGYDDRDHLLADTDLESLTGDPRFQIILSKISSRESDE